nr:hypothetical protein [Bacteroidota bacterium]
MIKFLTSTLLLLVGLQLCVSAQDDKFYTTTSGEMIFSFATIDNEGNGNGGVMRWSPFFNLQNMANYDFTNAAGVFTGINIRNIGFIYDVHNTNIRKKFRKYNVGIPVGHKHGNLKKLFIYGGYEIEFPINYKEKTFEGDRKTGFNSS